MLVAVGFLGALAFVALCYHLNTVELKPRIIGSYAYYDTRRAKPGDYGDGGGGGGDGCDGGGGDGGG